MKTLLALFIILFSAQAWSQQDTPYTLWWENYSAVNPASTGVNHKHYASSQAKVFSTSTESVQFIYELKSKKLGGGIGVAARRDASNGFSSNWVQANYAHHLNVSEKSLLSIGVGLGLKHINMKTDWLAIDGVENDPAINSQEESDAKFDANVGVLFQTEKFMAGVSSTHLTEPTLGETFRFNISRHYHLGVSYDVFSTENIEIIPMFYGVFLNEFNNYAATLQFVYRDKFWISPGVKSTDLLSCGAGVNLKNFRAGYNYDYSRSRLSSNLGNGNHEFFLAWLVD